MGKRGRKRKGYFYEEQEQAVVDYLTEKDLVKREKIFIKHIHILAPSVSIILS